MKKLMMIGVAALSCVALAQEPEGPKGGLGATPQRPENGPRAPRMSSRMSERGMMGGGMMGNDQAIMAVMNPKIAEKIGLDDATQLKIKEIDINLRKTNRELQKKTREAMEKQVKLMKEAKVDEAAVMSAIDELFDLRKEMAKAQTKRLIAVKALLTPEQLEKAVEEQRKMREERRGAKRINGPKGRVGRNAPAAPHEGGDHAKDDQPPPPPPAE